MVVKINIHRSPPRDPDKNPKPRLECRKFLNLLISVIFILSLISVVFWQDVHSNIATAASGQKYVFEKPPQAPEESEFYRHPPILEKAPPLVDRRVGPLEAYLASKKSPLAPYADVLVQHYHYRLIVGIAFAESNFCRHNIMPHNCWGIGGGRPAAYPDYPQAIERANYFIEKYFNDGLTNPELMYNRWVGWDNQNWPIAVEQVAGELEKIGI